MIRLSIEPRKTLRQATESILSAVRMDVDSLVVFNADGAAVRILAAEDGGLVFMPDRVTKGGASMGGGTGFPLIVQASATPQEMHDALYLAVKRSAKAARKIVQ